MSNQKMNIHEGVEVQPSESRRHARPRRRRLGQFRLRILGDIVAVVERVKKLEVQLRNHDVELADQLGRSSPSLALNAAEGSMARGRKRVSLLDVAMNSGREAIITLELGAAHRYLDRDEVEEFCDELDRIVATLYKVAYRRH